MRVRRQVGVRLFHTTRVDSRLTSTTIHYRVQVTLLDRPETGVRTGWLRCATCGNFVGLRIQTVEDTRGRKRRELLVLLLAAIAAVGLIVYVQSLPNEGVADALIAVLSIAGVLLFTTLVGAASMLTIEQGVRIAKSRYNGPHRTQPYGLSSTAHLLIEKGNTPADFIDAEF